MDRRAHRQPFHAAGSNSRVRVSVSSRVLDAQVRSSRARLSFIVGVLALTSLLMARLLDHLLGGDMLVRIAPALDGAVVAATCCVAVLGLSALLVNARDLRRDIRRRERSANPQAPTVLGTRWVFDRERLAVRTVVFAYVLIGALVAQVALSQLWGTGSLAEWLTSLATGPGGLILFGCAMAGGLVAAIFSLCGQVVLLELVERIVSLLVGRLGTLVSSCAHLVSITVLRSRLGSMQLGMRGPPRSAVACP